MFILSLSLIVQDNQTRYKNNIKHMNSGLFKTLCCKKKQKTAIMKGLKKPK